MKIINKHNFFPTVCVIFTLLTLGKILLEAAAQGTFGMYQGNLLLMFGISLLATFVLSQHYRLGRFPLLAVILGQYLFLAGMVLFITWLSSFFQPLLQDGYRDMFLSFTIPYVIFAAVYYVTLLWEIKQANEALKEIRRLQDDDENNESGE